ncbi:probable serine/threonine-protein kinase tsuA isoform X2 [Varroa jacobsoni]|uniref:probable serine/threonine-protein kinase tsuA isoform X2 n=1 Tax=Varroa jacobsoni TaxID=62625 RepID=UPI000BF985BC|nr:probable serine/threonine-protein kinase tsuA isoform X2 [Varroa jacobsoni]
MNQKKPRGFLNEAVWPNRITVRQDAISDSYAIETRPFARGKFATVRRCRHIESGRDFAAKYLRKRRRAEDVRHELIHEALVLALADSCKRIISLKEIFETPTEVILVLEMAAGGELQHVLDAEDCLPECSVRQLLLQIAEGLAFLHSQHIAHLDIKPANLLLSAAWPQVDAKLCDFGISRLILPGEEIHEIAGTPDYIAPEVLQYEPISLSTDMWSLGILTYVLLTGHTPFGGDTKQDTYCNITLGELDFPQDLFKDVTSEAIHFITQLVVKDPKKRLNIGEVLKHPWLTQPSPCPSFLAITAVIGVTNDNTSHLVANSNNVNNNNIHSNGKNSNKITNGIASYGLVVDSEQSPNPREDQEAVERLRGGAAVVQCETPSSSSIGSCEESDAEIIMEDQRGLQHQQPQSKQQIVNEDSSSDTINMNSDNNSRRSQSRNGVVEAKQTRGSSPVMAKRAIVNEVETPNVVAVAGHDDVVPNNPADSTIGVQLQHGETSEQLVQIHESSGEESESCESQSEPDSDADEDAPVQITDVTDDPESQAELEDHSATPIVTDSEDVLQSPSASQSNIYALHKNRKVLLSRLAIKEQERHSIASSGSVSSTTTSKSVSATDLRRSSVGKGRSSKKNKSKSKSQSNLSKQDRGKSQSDLFGHDNQQNTVIEQHKVVATPECVTMQSVRPKTPALKSSGNTCLHQNEFERRNDVATSKSFDDDEVQLDTVKSPQPEVAANIGLVFDDELVKKTMEKECCSEASNGHRKMKGTVLREEKAVVEESNNDLNNSSEAVDKAFNNNNGAKSMANSKNKAENGCKKGHDLDETQGDGRCNTENVTSEKVQKVNEKGAHREHHRPRSPQLSVFDRINQRAAKFMDIGSPLSHSHFFKTEFTNRNEPMFFRETNDLFENFQLRHGDLIGRFMIDFPFRNRDELGLRKRDLEKVNLRKYDAVVKNDTSWQYEKDVPLLSGELKGRCPFYDRLSRFDGTPRPTQKLQEEAPIASASLRTAHCIYDKSTEMGSFKQQEFESSECEPDLNVWQYQESSSVLQNRTSRLNGDLRRTFASREVEEDIIVDPESIWQYQDEISILSRLPKIPVKDEIFEETIQRRRLNALKKMAVGFKHAGEGLFTADDNDLIDRIMGTDLGDGLPIFKRAGYNDSSGLNSFHYGDSFETQPSKCSVQKGFSSDDASFDRFRDKANATDSVDNIIPVNVDVMAANKAVSSFEKAKRTSGAKLNRLLNKLDEWEEKIKNVRYDEPDNGIGTPVVGACTTSRQTDLASLSSEQINLTKHLTNAASEEMRTCTAEKIIEKNSINEPFKEYSFTSSSSGLKKTVCYQRTEVKKV